MENENGDGADNTSGYPPDTELSQSFVGKVRSHVSDLLNKSSLTKWFAGSSSPAVRRRQDDDHYVLQPPAKRAKRPSPPVHNSSFSYSDSPITYQCIPPDSYISGATKLPVNTFPEPGPSTSHHDMRLGPVSATRRIAKIPSTTTFSRDASFVNGGKGSDSEESTSGYSSVARVESKEKVGEEETEGDSLNVSVESTKFMNRSLFTSLVDDSRSLFTPRKLSPQQNCTSLSSRRPNFNASTFGTSTFVDRTLTTKKIMNSPFYSGPTQFGGAASARTRKIGTSTRNSVQIKPVNNILDNINTTKQPTSSGGGELTTTLSQTARRILNTLEQYSTPVSEAKKIPVMSRKDGLLLRYAGVSNHPYSRHRTSAKVVASSSSPCTNELQVPTIPDLLQMKQKERLQNSTVSMRQIATTSKSSLNKEYHLIQSVNDDDNDDKGSKQHSYKMKSSLKSLRQRPAVNSSSNNNNNKETEFVEVPDLPKIPLPITTLPKFDFVIAAPPSSNFNNKNNSVIVEQQKQKNNAISDGNNPTSNKKLVVTTTTTKADHDDNVRDNKIRKNLNNNDDNDKITINSNKMDCYKFSKPLIIAENLGKSMIVPINDFKFSEPLSKQSIANATISGSKKIDVELMKNKNNGENAIMNNNNSKSNKMSKDTTNMCLLDKFKPAEGTWECSTCLVRNQPDKMKCVACETVKSLKPELKNKTTSSTIFSKITSSTGSCLNFQFKPANDTWQCNVCLIRNKNELVKCAACETPNSKAMNKAVNNISTTNDLKFVSNHSFSTLASTANTWECPVCMIRNQNYLTKCAACETPNPIINNNKSSMVVVKSTNSLLPIISSSFGNKFKPPDNSWKCEACLLMNKNEMKKCIACETPRISAVGRSVTATSTTSCGDLSTSNQWQCLSCLVKNTSTSQTCTCCNRPRKVVVEATTTNNNNQTKDIGKISSFNYGMVSSNQFSFGIPKTDNVAANNIDSSLISSVFGGSSKSVSNNNNSSSTTSYTFGISSSQAATTTTAAVVVVSTVAAAASTVSKPAFTGAGAVSSTTSSSSSSSCVKHNNPLLKPSEKLPDKAESIAVTGFKFNVNSLATKSVPSVVKNNQVSAAMIATTTTTLRGNSDQSTPPKSLFTSTGSSFGSTSSSSNGDLADKNVNLFTAAAVGNKNNTIIPQQQQQQQIPAVDSTKVQQQQQTRLFNFAPSSSPATATITGGGNQQLSSMVTAIAPPTNNTNNMFKFGAAAAVATSSSTTTPPGSVANNFSSARKSINNNNKHGFDSVGNNLFSFGSDDAPPAKMPSFSFGRTDTSKTTTNSTTSTAEQQQQQQPIFKFGSNNLAGSSSSNNNMTTINQASSSSVSSAAAISTGGFIFAPNTNTATAPFAMPKLNTFDNGNNNNGVPAPSSLRTSGFNFTGGKSEPLAPSSSLSSSVAGQNSTSAYVFGSVEPTTALGANATAGAIKNGTFNFGAFANNNHTSTQKVGFTFGATSQMPSLNNINQIGGAASASGQSSSQGGFNFGGGAMQPNTSAGFNFTSPTAMPSFNFTSGNVPAFSAQSSTVGPQRKVKKALRRTTHR